MSKGCHLVGKGICFLLFYTCDIRHMELTNVSIPTRKLRKFGLQSRTSSCQGSNYISIHLGICKCLLVLHPHSDSNVQFSKYLVSSNCMPKTSTRDCRLLTLANGQLLEVPLIKIEVSFQIKTAPGNNQQTLCLVKVDTRLYVQTGDSLRKLVAPFEAPEDSSFRPSTPLQILLNVYIHS